MLETSLITRRTLVGTAALAGAAAVAGGVASLQAPAAFADSEGGEQTQYGFWIDTARCDGCGECVAACRSANHTPEDVPARRRIQAIYNEFGDEKTISVSCMHCSHPSCADVCPAGAIKKRSDGIVTVDHDRCIGCKYCYQACPFAVPHYTAEGMDKCDCCLEAGVPAGDTPNCVAACKKGALKFGKVDELRARSNNRAKFIKASTGPNCLFS